MRYIHVKLLFLSFCCMAIYCAGLQPNPRYNGGRTPKNEGHSDPRPLDFHSGYTEFQRRLAESVNSYLGVPYRWGGTTRSGMDCSGFVSTVYLNVSGLKLPRKARSMYKLGRGIDERNLLLGDLVFFERIENDGISHVGIYLKGREFAHASTSDGVTVSTLDDDYYRSRFVGARRIYNY